MCPVHNLPLALLELNDELVIRKEHGKSMVLDPVRKKFVRFNPEEWVRQLLLQYLIINQLWSKQLISVEKNIKVGQKIKRFDMLLFKVVDQPHVLIECKSPEEPLRQRHFDQILQYNIKLKVPFVWICNGHENYLAKVDFQQRKLSFQKSLDVLF